VIKVHRAKNSGTSAAEEPDDSQVWCDICGEEKDWAEIDERMSRQTKQDVCYRCAESIAVTTDGAAWCADANREMGLPPGEDWGSK
jgi:hypothetical protein